MAIDSGQHTNVPGHIREWFNRQVSPESGRSCCSIADGHETEEKTLNGQYWVAIEGKWYPVPPSRVIYNKGNPIGRPVVWYTRYPTFNDDPDADEESASLFTLNPEPIILCFVPGGGF